MFSLQIRGHPLIITAHGFFPLDNTLTYSVRKKINFQNFIVVDSNLSFMTILGIDNSSWLLVNCGSISIGKITNSLSRC